jgi:hypothetical protein
MAIKDSSSGTNRRRNVTWWRFVLFN